MNYVMIYRWATIAIAVNCLFRDLKANTNHQLAINCINMEILARGPLCTLIESLKHLCQHLLSPNYSPMSFCPLLVYKLCSQGLIQEYLCESWFSLFTRFPFDFGAPASEYWCYSVQLNISALANVQ